MLDIQTSCRIYLCAGYTDMRKGINGLSILSQSIISYQLNSGALFVFRGKKADRIRILWWDGQGFCLFYKCLDKGKFVWPSEKASGSIGVTKAQLSMLIEGIDWRNPVWSEPPKYMG